MKARACRDAPPPRKTGKTRDARGDDEARRTAKRAGWLDAARVTTRRSFGALRGCGVRQIGAPESFF